MITLNKPFNPSCKVTKLIQYSIERNRKIHGPFISVFHSPLITIPLCPDTEELVKGSSKGITPILWLRPKGYYTIPPLMLELSEQDTVIEARAVVYPKTVI